MTETRKLTTSEGHTIRAQAVYSSAASARRAALSSTRIDHLPALVLVGSRVWHVSGRDASRLARDGYERISLLGQSIEDRSCR